MLNLTRQERGFFLFLLVFFVLGTGVSIYKNHFMDHRALTPEQRARQNAFLEQFQNRSTMADSFEVSAAGNTVVATAFEAHGSVDSGYQSEGAPILSGKIDLNQANLADLTRLPRVGPVLARRIIEWRQENGPFKRIDELKKVKGIGQKTFEKISPYIIVKPN